MPRTKVMLAQHPASDLLSQELTGEFADLPVLDTKILKSLEKELATKGLRNYLKFYLSGTSERMEQIAEVANAGDLDQLSCLAHDMVSIAGNIGAIQLSCLARSLSRACRLKDGQSARRLLGELAIASLASNVAVRKWLD